MSTPSSSEPRGTSKPTTPHRLPLQADDTCAFLSPDTLVFDHFGPRIIPLGNFGRPPPLRSSISIQKRLADIRQMTALGGRRKADREMVNRSVDVGVNRSFVASRVSQSRRRQRPSSLQQLALTPDELSTYDHFVRLLRSFSPGSSLGILRQAQRDANLETH